MVDSPGGVALTGQCALVVKGCQGPGRVLTESGGCLGAVETKTTHGDILGVPRNGPNLPLPTCSFKPCFGEGLWLWSLGKKWENPRPPDSQSVTATLPPPFPLPIYSRTRHRISSGKFWWLE